MSYDPKRLQGITAYQEMNRDFAEGDRIQFTAPARDLTVSTRDLETIQRIEANRLTIRMDGEAGRTVTFDAKAMRHLGHGYAVTSHSPRA